MDISEQLSTSNKKKESWILIYYTLSGFFFFSNLSIYQGSRLKSLPQPQHTRTDT